MSSKAPTKITAKADAAKAEAAKKAPAALPASVPTPLFDRVKKDLGDPYVRPAVDRSYSALSRLSEVERKAASRAS